MRKNLISLLSFGFLSLNVYGASWSEILVVGYDLKQGAAKTVAYPKSNLDQYRDANNCEYRSFDAGFYPAKQDPNSIDRDNNNFTYPSRTFTTKGKVNWVQFSNKAVGGPDKDKRHFLSSVQTDFNLDKPIKSSHIWNYWKLDGSNEQQFGKSDDLWFVILEAKCN